MTTTEEAPATQGAGCSVKWSRGFGAFDPHCSQYPSSA